MKLRTLLLPAFALSLVAGFMTACESENTSSGDDLQISPSYKEIRAGTSVTLTASGADNYTWTLGEGVGGGLSNTKGSSTVYTSPSTLTSSGTQVITVVGTCLGAVSTNNAFTAQATIAVVVPEEKPQEEKPEVPAVAISGPSSVTVGSSCILSATGGKGSYTWSLMNGGGANCGSLSITSGAKTTFTALSAGEQRIKVATGKDYDILIVNCVE